MEPPGGHDGPGRDADPPAAFFGLWPRITEHQPDREPRRVALAPAQRDGGETDLAARLD